jgi:hypothetical protein
MGPGFQLITAGHGAFRVTRDEQHPQRRTNFPGDKSQLVAIYAAQVIL